MLEINKKGSCKICGKECVFMSSSGECWICMDKRQEEERRQTFLSNKTTETNLEKNIICPYCGYEFLSTSGEDVEDCAMTEKYCEFCNNDFIYCADVTVTFNTWRKD